MPLQNKQNITWTMTFSNMPYWEKVWFWLCLQIQRVMEKNVIFGMIHSNVADLYYCCSFKFILLYIKLIYAIYNNLLGSQKLITKSNYKPIPIWVS